MPRSLAAPAAAALALCLLLSACTATSPEGSGATPTPSAPPASAPPADQAGAPGRLPTCATIESAIDEVDGGALLDGLGYDEATSNSNTAAEAYEQRVCVWTTPDATTQLGVTIAEIPFQQAEIDAFATLGNAIADPRLAQNHAVLQTFATGDADDGHLDSALYLFDTRYSVTVQGVSDSGSTVATLPALSVAAGIDAAFAARGLVR